MSKKFHESKLFVMVRPNENSNELTITTSEHIAHQNEMEDLYHECFFKYVLNYNKDLTIKKHKSFLQAIFPILSYHFYNIQNEKSKELIKSAKVFFQTDKKSLDHINNLPDEVSQYDFILRYNFAILMNDVKANGWDVALQKNYSLYSDIEQAFFSLPICTCFSLIDLEKSIS